MGKIGEISLEDMLKTESARRFLLNGENKPLECSECKWKSICNGDCQNDWIYSDGNAHNYFCKSFETFFNYAINRLMNVAHAEYTARLNR